MTLAVIALATALAAMTALVFWQASSVAKGRSDVRKLADVLVYSASLKVALLDSEEEISRLKYENKRLSEALSAVKEVRDELISDAFTSGDPKLIDAAVRSAIDKLHSLSEQDDTLPGMLGADSKGSDDHRTLLGSSPEDPTKG